MVVCGQHCRLAKGQCIWGSEASSSSAAFAWEPRGKLAHLLVFTPTNPRPLPFQLPRTVLRLFSRSCLSWWWWGCLARGTNQAQPRVRHDKDHHAHACHLSSSTTTPPLLQQPAPWGRSPTWCCRPGSTPRGRSDRMSSLGSRGARHGKTFDAWQAERGGH